MWIWEVGLWGFASQSRRDPNHKRLEATYYMYYNSSGSHRLRRISEDALQFQNKRMVHLLSFGTSTNQPLSPTLPLFPREYIIILDGSTHWEFNRSNPFGPKRPILPWDDS